MSSNNERPLVYGVPGEVSSERRNGVHGSWQALKEIRSNPLTALDMGSGFRIAELHRSLAKEVVPPRAVYHKNGEAIQERPYWEIPHFEDNPVIEYTFHSPKGDEQQVLGGTMGQLPISMRALAVDLAAVVYGEHLLRFPEKADILFPNNSEAARQWQEEQELKLLTTMVGEYRDDHALVVVTGTHPETGKELILGSTGAIHGRGERNVLDTIGYDGIEGKPPSSLPTNYALTYSLSPKVKETLNGTKECEVSEVTRLWKVEDAAGIDTSRVSVALFSAIPQVVHEVTPEVKFMIFNTKDSLSKILSRVGFPVIHATDDPGSIRPTPGVLKTIHGDYFEQMNQASGTLVYPQFLSVPEGVETSKRIQASLGGK